jgi:hypothetical protein
VSNIKLHCNPTVSGEDLVPDLLSSHYANGKKRVTESKNVPTFGLEKAEVYQNVIILHNSELVLYIGHLLLLEK